MAATTGVQRISVISAKNMAGVCWLATVAAAVACMAKVGSGVTQQ